MLLRAGDGRAGDPVRHGGPPRCCAGAGASVGIRLSSFAGPPPPTRWRGGPGRTVLAGFPWFTDWGRDTFIAMRGLLLATGRLDEARAGAARRAGGDIDGGMLPNRFPDTGHAPEFNAVDASLWFIVAVHDTLDACAAAGLPLSAADEGPAAPRRRGHLGRLVWRARGLGSVSDADGLLRAGQEGVQRTWMDAITDGHVVTPRRGKPVEIQALWVNALAYRGGALVSRLGRPRNAPRGRLSRRGPRTPRGGLHDVRAR